MDLSTGHPLTAQHPGLADALTDPFIRAVWELLRRRARASTVDELAEVMQAPRESIARALARLKALGLVRPAFEPGTRRRSAFKIARERLVIVYNRDDRMQAETAQAIRSRVVEHGRSVLETARVQGASRDDEGVEDGVAELPGDHAEEEVEAVAARIEAKLTQVGLGAILDHVIAATTTTGGKLNARPRDASAEPSGV